MRIKFPAPTARLSGSLKGTGREFQNPEAALTLAREAQLHSECEDLIRGKRGLADNRCKSATVICPCHVPIYFLNVGFLSKVPLKWLMHSF